MGFLKKIFGGVDSSEIEEEVQAVELSLDDLKGQVNESLKKVNDLGDRDYVETIISALNRVKSSINALMARSLNNEYNKALLIGANNARRRVHDQLIPLLEFKVPEDLVGVNSFIKSVEKLLIRASEVSGQSAHAQVIFRDDMKRLSDSFDLLSDELDSLKEAVRDRNEQLESFNNLVKELRTYDESLERLEGIRREEFNVRKKISSYERDKTFLSSEIARIKSIEVFEELNNALADLKVVKKRKSELEGLTMNIVSKFSRILRKVFREADFVAEFLTNPLAYMCANEGLFNKRMSQLVAKINSGKLKLSDKDKKRYLKAISDDKVNDYITEYRSLLAKERSLNKGDFTLLKRAEAFERRLMELNRQANSDIKKLDSFKERVDSQKREIDALKAKVEVVASECYAESVRLV